MRNSFTFNGTSSTAFGVYISGQGTFDAPRHEYSVMTVPGRNGDLVVDGKRFENFMLTYPAFIYTNFDNNLRALRNFLLSSVGYQRLTDTYHPDEFRMALYEGAFIANVEKKNDAGSFDITFNCKPQRFLLTGETVTTLTSSGTITNPTLFEAKPLLKVYGQGALGINSDTITITSSDTFIYIDCERQDAYRGTANKNGNIQLSNYNFPVLKAGSNSIALGTGITKVEITPRWWQI